MHLRAQLDTAVELLNTRISEMGALVKASLEKALRAFTARDSALASEVRRDDAAIDDLQKKIEDSVGVIIATQQPVARDMRYLLTTLKVINNLERAGDHAAHLAKTAIKLEHEPFFAQEAHIVTVAGIETEMVDLVVKAFLGCDVALARRVAGMDDKVDSEHKALIREALDHMKEDPHHIEHLSRLISTSGFLERLGDHVTNICEAIVFMVDGTHIELNE